MARKLHSTRTGRDVIRRHALWLIALALVSLVGCFIPAPIEEEVPEEDTPPRIEVGRDLTPNPLNGETLIELEEDGPKFTDFFVENIHDDNEDQVLYARAVLELGGIGLNFTLVSQDEIPPEARSTRIVLDPCAEGLRQLLASQAVPLDGRQYPLWVGISDDRFIEVIGSSSIADRMTTENNREVAIAQWTIEFVDDPGFPDNCFLP